MNKLLVGSQKTEVRLLFYLAFLSAYVILTLQKFVCGDMVGGHLISFISV